VPRTTTDPNGLVTRWAYDGLGRETRETRPDGTSTTLALARTERHGAYETTLRTRTTGGADETVVLDERGRVVRRLWFGPALPFTPPPARVMERIVFDPLGEHVERRSLPAPEGTPDAQLHDDVFDYDATGRVTKHTTPWGLVTKYTYDDFARPRSTTLAVAGDPASAAMTVTLGYDPLGRLSTVTYPPSAAGGFAVENGYDAYGHLIEVDDVATGAMYWKISAVDGEGRIQTESFGNGAVTARSYHDDMQRLATLKTTAGLGTVQDLEYAYDPRLNLESRTDRLQQGPQGQPSMSEQFRYDPLDRLTCSYLGPADPHAPCRHAWTFDAAGDIETKDGVAYHYDDMAHPHAVTSVGSGSGASTYGYDDVGNQIARNGAAVTYTPFDLPSALATSQGDVTLDHDGDEQRIRKSDPGGDVTEYLGDLYERLRHADGTQGHVYYVHGAERAVAVVTVQDAFGTSFGPPVKTRYVHVDHLGSIDAITDEQGHVVDRRSYEPFGERRNQVWGGPTPTSFSSATTLGFTGHEADDELGLVNMKGRMYDPKLGRFLTPDPLVSAPYHGQSWNPYSYVVNNPLAFVDPSGFEGTTPAGCDATCTQLPDGEWFKQEVGPKVTTGRSTMQTVVWIRVPPDPPKPVDGPPQDRDPPGSGDSRDSGASHPVNDVGTTGDTSGPTAGATSGGEQAPGDWKHHPAVEAPLGVVVGVVVGLVPYGGVGHQLLTGTRVLPSGSPAFQQGLGAGMTLGGIYTMVTGAGGAGLGALLSLTGAGSPVGAPVTAVSVAAVVGGAANAAAGLHVLTQAFSKPPAGGATSPGPRRFSPEQRERAWERSKDANGTPRCEYCGKEITKEPGKPNTYEADHKNPYSRGGPTKDENLAPACRTCNRSKGAQTIEEFEKR
jgi:RHS repeat-associated protein